MKRFRPLLIIFIVIVLIIFAAPYTHWEQCRQCGVQRFERFIFRTKVPAWSIEELDEYGTYAQWKALNRKDICEHRFFEVKHKTPAMSLEQLEQDESPAR